MRFRRAATLVLAAFVATTATGCAKRTIDPDATGSVEVPGTDGSLQKFCDGSVLIYWTPNVAAGESDDYEFIVYYGCVQDENGTWIPGTTLPLEQPAEQAPTEDLQQGDDDD